MDNKVSHDKLVPKRISFGISTMVMVPYSLVLLSLSLISLTHASPVKRAPTVCNGYGALCNRSYSNITFIGTHDSAFVGSTSDPRVNQEKSVTDQLNAGIRFLQAQTHNLAGQLSMCHTSCLELYAGSLVSYLQPIKTWLDANPNEVVSMLLVNGDNVAVSQFDSAFSSAGLKDYAFVPSGSPAILPIASWPTLSNLISTNKRLIVFIDAGAATSTVPYILPEFSYYFETPYDVTDASFGPATCNLDRPAGSSPDGKMYIVNHFLDQDILGVDIPYDSKDSATNAASGTGSIGAQVSECQGVYGRKPNVVLVDMFDRGDVFTAQNTLNGVS